MFDTSFSTFEDMETANGYVEIPESEVGEAIKRF